MTRYILAVMLAGLASGARALDFAQPVIIGVQSTITVSGIAISSAPATSIVVSTQALYRQVCVQNLDVGNFLSCGSTINVSTVTTNGLAGVVIATASATGLPFCFEIVPGTNFYCRSSSVTGSSRVVIIRKR